MSAPLLTPRWYPLDYHPVQARLRRSKARFRMCSAGRRSGKSEIAKRFLEEVSIDFVKAPDGLFVAGAPTRDQAKRIFWKDLKALTPKWLQLREPSETDLTIYLVNGAEISVVGFDKPERIEGRPLDGIILDEYANMKAKAWPENIRPALSTRGRPGWAWLIGVPEGRNHYYDLWLEAEAKQIADPDGEWAAFTWKSADIIDPAEVASARDTLDPRTFRQEYEGAFENFAGAAYYTFKRDLHAAERLTPYYDPKQPLITCFDFNVKPGVAAIGQEFLYTGPNLKVDRKKPITGWIGEVWIPDYSNSRLVAEAVVRDWGYHQGEIWVEGDATGGNRGSAKIDGTDWEIILRILRTHFGDRVIDKVPRSNTKELPRVAAMNCRFESTTGVVRMLVDPQKCPHIVRDCEGVTFIEGTMELLKVKGGPLSHLTDAMGYHVVRVYPVREGEPREPMQLRMA